MQLETQVDSSTARKTAVKAALEAGAYIKERLGQIKRIDYKGAFNIVTDVDKTSESMILEILRSQFPDDSTLAEESGVSSKSAKRRWLVDPLDGTTNFTHSYPFFCVSIALEQDDEMVVAVVYNPISGELFRAEKGEGAFLNDEPMHVSAIDNLNESLLATGFPPDTVNNVHNNLEAFATLTNLCHGVRRDGSAALDLCYVASGRLEGFWELKLSPWDVAAGSLIVTEAGGTVTDLSNKKLDMSTGHILATNGKIHDQVVRVLDEVGRTASRR